MVENATMLDRTTKDKAERIRVGQAIEFGSPWNRHKGLVIEDRGFLGVGGRQIVRVRYYEDYADNGDWTPEETEVPAEEVTLLDEFIPPVKRRRPTIIIVRKSPLVRKRRTSQVTR